MAGFKSFYVGPKLNIGENVQLDKHESHHLVNVLRARNGEKVTLFDGKGGVWEGLLDVRSKEVYVKIILEVMVEKPKCNIILAQAMPKGKGMEEILQKAAEIGVQKIIPLKTDRTELKLDQERESKRIDRWRTTLIEACKQSSNFYLPEVFPVASFKDFLKECKGCDALKLTASLETRSQFLNEYLKEKIPCSIIWLVGPEGDFTKEEYELAFENAFQPIRLSKNVLRVETAATYALSITDYEINSKAKLKDKV